MDPKKPSLNSVIFSWYPPGVRYAPPSGQKPEVEEEEEKEEKEKKKKEGGKK